MCGISLLIPREQQQPDEGLLRAMNQKVVHRGPDDEGTYLDDRVGLGHRRLSIIEVTEKGHQPMHRDGLRITYNGEIYNYVELRATLETLGHTFHTASDTEVMLAAWRQWGPGALDRFNGMWAFVLYDTQARKIYACRDQFGIKPLFYTVCGDLFLAGSEIKQFMAAPGFRAVLDERVAYNFLVNGWLSYSADTFFQGVKSVNPGCYLEYDLDSHEFYHHQWYNLATRVKPVQDDFESAKRKVYDLLRESVQIRMRADVRVGSCLSGGIDSSGIVSMIHEHQYANGDFATITSCYHDNRFDERAFSKVITDHTGYPALQVFPDLDDLIHKDHLDLMLYHQEQPVNTASHYSEFKVFETAAAAGLKVMQDGQGADEYCWGYEEFFQTLFQSNMSGMKLGQAYRLLQRKALHNESSIRQEANLALMTNYIYPLIPRYKKILNRPRVEWLRVSWQRRWAPEEFVPAGGRCETLSLEQMQSTSLPYQLHSEDRNSMLFSIESRLPYLDHRLVEYVMGLPASFKIQQGYSKYILREALAALPERIRYRKHKMGFPAPDSEWIRSQRDFVRAELRGAIARLPFLNDALLSRFEKFLEGSLGYESIYLRVITLNRLVKLFSIQLQ